MKLGGINQGRRVVVVMGEVKEGRLQLRLRLRLDISMLSQWCDYGGGNGECNSGDR